MDKVDKKFEQRKTYTCMVPGTGKSDWGVNHCKRGRKIVKEEKKKVDMEICKNTWGKDDRREDELGHRQKELVKT